MILLEDIDNIVKRISRVDFKSKCRKRPFADARKVFIKASWEYVSTISKSEIARFLNIDHTTVLVHLRSFQGIYDSDYEFRKLYNEVVQSIKERTHLKFASINDEIEYHEKEVDRLKKLINVCEN